MAAETETHRIRVLDVTGALYTEAELDLPAGSLDRLDLSVRREFRPADEVRDGDYTLEFESGAHIKVHIRPNPDTNQYEMITR